MATSAELASTNVCSVYLKRHLVQTEVETVMSMIGLGPAGAGVSQQWKLYLLLIAEFAYPYTVLSEIADITVVSLNGCHSQVDLGSVNNTASTDTVSHSFLRDREEIWTNTSKISDFVGKGKDFDVLCCPGGYASLFDLAEDNDLKSLIRDVYEAGKIVAAICHGVIVFKDVKLLNNEYLVANSPVTGFSNEEEDKAGLTDII
ncbi:hypothetical protein B7463_g5700, partial [Scytalidium lignicola]